MSNKLISSSGMIYSFRPMQAAHYWTVVFKFNLSFLPVDEDGKVQVKC